MIKKIKELYEFSAKTGFFLPAAYDFDKPGPSVSLLFAHISFYVAIGSIIYLIYKDVNLGTVAAISFAVVYFIFYMLRKLTKAKVDLDDKSFELENGSDDSSTEKEK
jgi:hypothetical protein